MKGCETMRDIVKQCESCVKREPPVDLPPIRLGSEFRPCGDEKRTPLFGHCLLRGRQDSSRCTTRCPRKQLYSMLQYCAFSVLLFLPVV